MAFDSTLWGRRVQLTGLSPSASLSGFIALVSLDNVPVEAIDAGSNSALNGGGDLRFSTDNAGVNQLPLEVVEYVADATEGNRRCHLFIRFPTYSSGARDVWMFYDKAAETQPAVGAAFGRNAVYVDREFQYNLHDSSSVIDSSGNSTPTVNGTLSDDQTSPFGSGVNFDDDEWLDLGSDVGDTTGDISYRCWLEAPVTDSFSTIMSQRAAAVYSFQWRLEALDPALLIGTASPNSPGPVLVTGTWYQLVMTVSGTTITYYRNGVSQGTDSVTGSRSLTGINTFIADISDASPPTNPTGISYIGALADMSIEFGAVPIALVKSEYDNKNDASTFWTTGTPEDTAVTGGANNPNDFILGIAGLTSLSVPDRWQEYLTGKGFPYDTFNESKFAWLGTNGGFTGSLTDRTAAWRDAGFPDV